MRRLHPDWGRQDVIDHNLRPADGSDERGTRVTVFAEKQRYRVERTRAVITAITHHEGPGRLSIAEPGCSAGDISGWFSEDHAVWGNDVVPAAVQAANERWPKALWELGPAEDFEPLDCDVLVLCEFLEHIADPITFVKAWAPLAKYVIISHPLVGDGHDPEDGHFWAYDREDFEGWFRMSGHRLVSPTFFDMGPYRMALGLGVKE